jgi:hypothetical protein
MPQISQLQQWLAVFKKTLVCAQSCFHAAMALAAVTLLPRQQQDDHELRLLEAVALYHRADLHVKAYAALAADAGDIHVQRAGSGRRLASQLSVPTRPLHDSDVQPIHTTDEDTTNNPQRIHLSVYVDPSSVFDQAQLQRGSPHGLSLPLDSTTCSRLALALQFERAQSIARTLDDIRGLDTRKSTWWCGLAVLWWCFNDFCCRSGIQCDSEVALVRGR